MNTRVESRVPRIVETYYELGMQNVQIIIHHRHDDGFDGAILYLNLRMLHNILYHILCSYISVYQNDNTRTATVVGRSAIIYLCDGRI